ncbi:hypothetical protein [Spiribacter onubensis]|uniref:Small-conductance mechanosensitive channel n=1 Tax=Spiribacter onubensis TaxID=3122420 RepID=A0ABV3S7B9_9GAMM
MTSIRNEHSPGVVRRHGLQTAAIVLLIVVAPLVGSGLAGIDAGAFLRFPPRPLEPAPGSFTPWAFALYALLIVGVLAPFVLRITTGHAPAASRAVQAASEARPFPAWGWAAVGMLALAWLVAWVPIPGLEEARRLSFTPLWVAYTIGVSAWIQRRGGRVLMLEQPRRFLALFPASALFWYLFEYINQFTGNWIYAGTGVADHQALNWFLRSALPFSTVLPAVVVTRDLFATWPALSRGLDDFLPIRPSRPRVMAAWLLLAGVVGLVAVAVWPDALYALVWVGPPLIIVAVQAMSGERHLFSPVCRGDWRDAWLAVLAALFCGLCWELWNIFSLARWTYHIPHAQVLHVFEMPLLGYAGYLPFGITCIVAAQLLTGLDPRARYR